MGTNNSRPVDDAVDRDKLCQYDEFDDGEVCGAPLADYSANYRQDIACRRHADLVCKWCKEAFSLRKEFGRGIDLCEDCYEKYDAYLERKEEQDREGL